MSVEFSDVEPSVEADIVLKIDYNEGSSSAAHAFEIAAELIRSMEQLDQVLTQSIHPQLSTALVVEDLQKSSLKIFLKSVLEDVPDEALKDANIKKLVGHYLLKSKYAAIRWLDKSDDEPKQISDLTTEISEFAKETDLRHLPDYPPPNPSRLAQPLDRFQEAKKKFDDNEELTITLGPDEYKVHLDRTWVPSETIKEEDGDRELTSEQDQYLTIGRPDFFGETMWSFKHGKVTVRYRIADQDWLDNFRAGQYPIKPGDALRVRIRVKHTYDASGNLLESTEEIVRVYSIIEKGSGSDRLV